MNKEYEIKAVLKVGGNSLLKNLLCPFCLDENSLIIEGTQMMMIGRKEKLSYVRFCTFKNKIYKMVKSLFFETYIQSPKSFRRVKYMLNAKCQSCGFSTDKVLSKDNIHYIVQHNLYPGDLSISGFPINWLTNRKQFNLLLNKKRTTTKKKSSIYHIYNSPISFKKNYLKSQLISRTSPGFLFGDNVLNLEQAFPLLELSYYLYFINNSQIVGKLCKNYKDIFWAKKERLRYKRSYQNAEENLDASYDIAIKRSLSLLGKEFRGDKILDLSDSNIRMASILHPQNVPFSFPKFIRKPEKTFSNINSDYKWNKGSMESFWRNNRVLIKEKLPRKFL